MSIDAKLERLIELLEAIYCDSEEIEPDTPAEAPCPKVKLNQGQNGYAVVPSPLTGEIFVWCYEPRGDSHIEYVKLLSGHN